MWEQHLSDLLAARDALNERLTALGDPYDDRPVFGPYEFTAAGQRDALRAMLKSLSDGPIDPEECRTGNGTLASIQQFDRLPGIRESERRIAEFRTQEEEAAREIADGDTLYPFQLRQLTRQITQLAHQPPYGKFFVDDGANEDGSRRLRRLKPGETIMLTRQRAERAGLVLEEVSR